MIIKMAKRDNSDEDAKYIEHVEFNVDSYTLRQRDFGIDELIVNKNNTSTTYINLNCDTFYVMNDNGKTIDRGILRNK